MGPIASVFGYIMDFLFRITSSMGIMNIGLCIILFTIITKLLLFPLTIKQQESSKLMSLMNPEIKAVQNRYKGKTDQASMAKQQVEMQAVYEKYGFRKIGTSPAYYKMDGTYYDFDLMVLDLRRERR